MKFRGRTVYSVNFTRFKICPMIVTIAHERLENPGEA